MRQGWGAGVFKTKQVVKTSTFHFIKGYRVWQDPYVTQYDFLRINLVKLQAQFLDYILSAVKPAFKEESHPEQQTAFSSSLV